MENISDPHPSRWAGLRTRIIWGAALAVPVLAALWLGGWLFILMAVAAGLVMLREWDGLTAAAPAAWKWLGLLYVGAPCASLIWLRQARFANMEPVGGKLVLFILLVVWATDIGAYFAGKKLGGPKLAPMLSPGKTWAGLGGGIVAAAVVGAAASAFTPYPASFIACMDVGVLMAIVAQAGDLFESWLKRRAGVKDSGALIPGHGGLLDRVDGLVFTLPFFAWLVYLSGDML
ncbi:MAG: phosphatidate cytidylyltransferase [Pseudomonadota bacterium]|nr:phosphatidate cytidylyltransferase [Pseudomonadota bacterium]